MTRIAIAVVALLLGSGGALAQDDVAAGETVFKKCSTCHMVGANARTKVGPILNGVVGRTAGTLEGFKYSDAMVKAGEDGLIWTPETLGAFVAKPKDVVPGTKMAFAGVPKPEDVAKLVAYLLTLSPEYVPPAQ